MLYLRSNNDSADKPIKFNTNKRWNSITISINTQRLVSLIFIERIKEQLETLYRQGVKFNNKSIKVKDFQWKINKRQWFSVKNQWKLMILLSLPVPGQKNDFAHNKHRLGDLILAGVPMLWNILFNRVEGLRFRSKINKFI